MPVLLPGCEGNGETPHVINCLSLYAMSFFQFPSNQNGCSRTETIAANIMTVTLTGCQQAGSMTCTDNTVTVLGIKAGKADQQSLCLSVMLVANLVCVFL